VGWFKAIFECLEKACGFFKGESRAKADFDPLVCLVSLRRRFFGSGARRTSKGKLEGRRCFDEACGNGRYFHGKTEKVDG
jgi:hypothetical protein